MEQEHIDSQKRIKRVLLLGTFTTYNKPWHDISDTLSILNNEFTLSWKDTSHYINDMYNLLVACNFLICCLSTISAITWVLSAMIWFYNGVVQPNCMLVKYFRNNIQLVPPAPPYIVTRVTWPLLMKQPL